MGGLNVSVVIPTHDRCALLGRALASVRSQTHPPSELIVVDDGSTDGTAAMVRRDHPEAVLIEQSQRGVSAARNRGIAAAGGEWIAFLDSDDEWLPAKLERQVAALAEDDAHRICHTDEIWVRDGRRVNAMKKHAKRGGDVFDACLTLCCMSPSSVLLHRGLLDEVGSFDESLPACEDYDLWLRIACRFPVLFVDEPLVVKYGGHDDQLSRRHWGMDRFRIAALQKLLEHAPLTRRQRSAAEEVLADKIEIFAAGAHKRGRVDEAREYRSRLARLLGRAEDDSRAG